MSLFKVRGRANSKNPLQRAGNGTIEELESILGSSESVHIFIEIEEEYQGNEIDILNALMTRSDLVERAIASILKDKDHVIFQTALNSALVKINST